MNGANVQLIAEMEQDSEKYPAWFSCQTELFVRLPWKVAVATSNFRLKKKPASVTRALSGSRNHGNRLDSVIF